jgi:hypothetical protein
MANYTWNGSGNSASGNWSDVKHWHGSIGFPNSLTNDTATIAALNNTFTVTVDGAYAVSTLTLTQANTTAHTTTVDIPTGDSLHIGTGGLSMGYNTVLSVEGTLTVDGALTVNGAGGGSYANPYIALNGGTVDLTNAYTSTTTVNISPTIGFDFGGGNGTFDIAGSGASGGSWTFGSAITNFGVGDTIDLTGAGTISSFTPNGGNSYTLVTSLGTYNFSSIAITGGALHAVSDGNGGVELFVCYQAGTHILTPRGEVAVEDLREGDLVTTFSGRGPIHKPITWIGQMRESLDGHPDPEMAAPVRIRAGAVAENVPHRDLLVSPDHAICLDGVLIPAKELVNGATIVQDLDFGEVHYFHIELEQHDILLAEGLTAESYLDTGNRDAFAAYRATPVARQEAEPRVG